MTPFRTLAALLMALVAVAHALRVAFGWPVTIGSYSVPIWASVIAALGAAFIAIMLWREGRRS